MKNLFLWLLLSLASTLFTQAQPDAPKDITAVFRQLKQSNADTARVNLFLKIARYFNDNAGQRTEYLDSSIKTTAKALQLAKQIGYAEGEGFSYQLMAHAFCAKKVFKKSDQLIRKSIEIFLANNLYRDAAEAYLNIEQFHLAAGGNDFNYRIKYYEMARPLFHKAGAWKRQGETLTLLGDFYQIKGDYDRALKCLNDALVAYKKANYKYLQATYDLIGMINTGLSRYNEGLKYGLLALKAVEATHDTSMMVCTIYNRLGVTYYLANKIPQSKPCFEKALAIAKKYKDIRAEHVVIRALTNVLSSENKHDEALALVKETRAKFTVEDAGAMKWCYASFIGIYSDKNNFSMAELYTDSLLRTNIFSKENIATVYGLDALTSYLIKSRQFDRALKYLPQYNRLSSRLSMKRDEYRSYLRFFQADSAKGNYLPAIENYRRYFVLQDSLYDIEKTGQFEELKIKYETDEKEHNIATLQRNSHLQAENLKRANLIRNIIIGALIALLTLTLLLYKSFRINKQNAASIELKNEELKSLVKEKEWLLKEIHHRVKNNLQIVMGLLQRQSAYINNDEALAAIQNSENRMHSIALIHQKLYQSENLDLISMPEYIDEMLTYLKDSCDVDNRILFEKHLDDIYLDVSQAVPLGLILNEAITNAIKYAYLPGQTGNIYVTLVKNGDDYNQLTIADDGAGLPTGFAIEKVESLGINLMRGLTKQLGGTFDIYSDDGCTINIVFKTEIFNRGITKNK